MMGWLSTFAMGSLNKTLLQRPAGLGWLDKLEEHPRSSQRSRRWGIDSWVAASYSGWPVRQAKFDPGICELRCHDRHHSLVGPSTSICTNHGNHGHPCPRFLFRQWGASGFKGRKEMSGRSGCSPWARGRSWSRNPSCRLRLHNGNRNVELVAISRWMWHP